MICITGGEPFLHPALAEIIRLSRELGFTVGITSNGTLIDDAAGRSVVESGLNTVAISIDGLEEEHDQFRNRKGSYQKALQGIHNLLECGADPQVITVVHPGNIGSLQTLYEVLQKERVTSWRLVNIEPIGRARTNKEILLGSSEMKRLFEFIRDKRFDSENAMEITFGCSHFASFEYEREIRDYYFQCIAGTQVASIMANGDIGACLDIERRPELIQGNINHDDFIDVWENRFEVFRRNRALSSPVCSGCQDRFVCRGDSAHTWDYENNVPLYCVCRMLEEET